MSNTCTNCHKTPTNPPYTLCPNCEISLALAVLHLYTMLDTLNQLMDASVKLANHGEHAPSAEPPTPIRLNILDLLDLLDATAWVWYRLINPPQATTDANRSDIDVRDVGQRLLAIAASPRLAMIASADMVIDEALRLDQRVSGVCERAQVLHPVGHCLNRLCGVVLYAADGDELVECQVCASVWRVMDVRLALWRECVHNRNLVSAVDASRLLGMCGIKIAASTIRSWHHRGWLTSVDGLYRLADITPLAQRLHAD